MPKYKVKKSFRAGDEKTGKMVHQNHRPDVNGDAVVTMAEKDAAPYVKAGFLKEVKKKAAK